MLRKVMLVMIACLVAFAVGMLVFHHGAAPGKGATGHAGQSEGAPSFVRRTTAPPLTAGTLLSATERSLGMDMSRASDYGRFGSGTAAVHLVAAPAANGQSCLLVDEPGGPATTCLPGSLFSLHKVVYLVQSDGGPKPTNLRYFRIVGVAAPEVDELEVVFDSGSVAGITLNAFGAFAFEASLSKVHGGDLPKTLIAYSGSTAIAKFPVSQ